MIWHDDWLVIVLSALAQSAHGQWGKHELQVCGIFEYLAIVKHATQQQEFRTMAPVELTS